jgi:hypothetical protein
MLDGNLVFIEGANEAEYNGIKTISNVTTNAYDYTVSGSPATPATGTIIATAVLISNTTNDCPCYGHGRQCGWFEHRCTNDS